MVYPNFWQASRLVVLYIFVGIVGVLIATLVSIELGLEFSEYSLILALPLNCIVIWWGWRKTRASFSSIFPLARFRIEFCIPILITIIGLAILTSEIDNYIRLIVPMPAKLVEVFNFINEKSSLGFQIFVVVIFATVSEELLFRGLILNGFLRNYSFKKALLWSAFLFGILHLNPWQFHGAFLGGLIWGWWVAKTRSLWPSLLGHSLNNICAIFIHEFILFEMPGESVSAVVFQPWWLNVSGLVLSACGIYWFYKIDLKRRNTFS